MECIEKELAEIRNPVLPMWSASTLITGSDVFYAKIWEN
jgi:hypothetical protein